MVEERGIGTPRGAQMSTSRSESWRLTRRLWVSAGEHRRQGFPRLRTRRVVGLGISCNGPASARGDPPHGLLASVARDSHGRVAGVLADVSVEAAEVAFVAGSEGSDVPAHHAGPRPAAQHPVVK